MALEVGQILEGKITSITKFGAFVDLPEGKTGMVHISEVAPTYVKEIRDFVTENQVVKVKVLSISEDGKIALSIKKALPQPTKQQNYNQRRQSSPGRPGNFEWQNSRKAEATSFEDMMSRFKQTSDEKMSDLKRFGGESNRRGGSRRGNNYQPK